MAVPPAELNPEMPVNTADIAARVIASAPPVLAPPSLLNSPTLFAWNLFVMTAAAVLGLMMAGKQLRRIWGNRMFDHPTDPVSIYRFILLLAGAAMAVRSGAEAVHLWSWSSNDRVTIRRVLALKRWLDSIAVGCGFAWMGGAVLGEPKTEFQLRKAPLPVNMWSRWPALRRPLAVLSISLVMTAAAAWLR